MTQATGALAGAPLRWPSPSTAALGRAGAVLAFAVLLALRMPEVVLHGRLWAEEGTVFYSNAASLPWWDALFRPYAGYLNIVGNVAGIAAHGVVPLEAAPWVMSGIGLLFQCAPAVLVVSSADAWLRPVWVRVAALLLIATVPQTEEIWLASLASQFHLALCAALVLALDIPRRRVAVFGGAMLFIAPLCGPPAAALLPLFCLRALLDRSAARLLQAVPLAVGTCLQLGLFYTHDPARSYGIGPFVLIGIVYIRQIVVPLAGLGLAGDASNAVQDHFARGQVPWFATGLTLGCFVLVAVSLVRRCAASARWMFAAGCATGFIAYFGALGGNANLVSPGWGQRYVFLPEVLGALTLLGIAASAEGPARWVARAVVAWMIVVAGLELDDGSAIKSGPDWLGEVAAWRRDADHPIAIWPDKWFVKLKQP